MKIYYSLPAMLDSASHIFNSSSTQLRTRFENVTCSKWKGGSYNPNLLDNCDIFVFTTINNKFKFYMDDLPSGVKKELKRAIKLKKEIFLIYKTSDERINFYKVDIDEESNYIQGIAGTSSYMYNYIDDNEGKVNKDIDVFIPSDELEEMAENNFRDYLISGKTFISEEKMAAFQEEVKRQVYAYPVLKQEDFEIKFTKDKRVLL